jgi:hypothetical protein
MKRLASTLANLCASFCVGFMVLVLYLSLPPQLYFSLFGLGAASLLVSSALEDRQDPED